MSSPSGNLCNVFFNAAGGGTAVNVLAMCNKTAALKLVALLYMIVQLIVLVNYWSEDNAPRYEVLRLVASVKDSIIQIAER